MIGAVVLILLMAVVFPPIVFGGGALVSLLLGITLRQEAVARHEGSELIDLNR